MLVKPAPGLTVLRPDTFEPLPHDRATDVDGGDPHWIRALRDGDVVEHIPAPKPAKRKPAQRLPHVVI